MQMYLISDNIDTYTGMRLAGVEGSVVHDRQELKEILNKVMADKTIGIGLLYTYPSPRHISGSRMQSSA